jgi:hypothetical protein
MARPPLASMTTAGRPARPERRHRTQNTPRPQPAQNGTLLGGSCAGSLAVPESANGLDHTRCVTPSSPPPWMPVCRCATCKKRPATATPPTSSPRSLPALRADQTAVRCASHDAPTSAEATPSPTAHTSTTADRRGPPQTAPVEGDAPQRAFGAGGRSGPTTAELSHRSAEARHRGSCRTRKRFSTRVSVWIAGVRLAPNCRRYLKVPNPGKVADLPHTIGDRCTASPSVGRRADGVKRFRRAGGGRTERNSRTTAPNHGRRGHRTLLSREVASTVRAAHLNYERQPPSSTGLKTTCHGSQSSGHSA